MTDAIRTEIARLNALPCECVTCGECGGTGEIAYSPSDQFDDDFEPCDGCSGGIVQVCERCLEIQELEN